MGKESIRDFKDLVAWQKGMDLAVVVYRLTGRYPREERFGLVAQSRRAAVSVPSNVAEGFGRSGRGDFLRFLDHSIGSANEVETQVLLAVRLGFINDTEAAPAIDLTREEQRVLKGLVRGIANTGKGNVRV